MRRALKIELAVISGILAGKNLISRSPSAKFWASTFSLTTLGFILSFLEHAYDFRGKSVYITGGSRGLGLSLAWNLLAQGAVVTLVARDEEELKKAKDILLRDYPHAVVFTSVCDVTNGAELARSLDKAIENMNGIDLLVNNAGSILVGPFTSMEREDFEAQMKLHLYATIESTQLILPHFQQRGGGRILNICSVGGKVALPHMLPYDASKFALAGFSQGVNAELCRYNVQVTTAFPTVMRTGSPAQAVFKGDHEKEFQWFNTIDHLPFLSMSADTAAKKILRAVADGKSEIVLSVAAKSRLFISRIFPETVYAISGLIARLLPRGDSTVRKTGAESSAHFKKSILFSPLRKTVHKEEQTYNQENRHDAEFNLNLH